MADTFPSEVYPAEATITALDGTTDQATGLEYIAKGTGPSSSPTYEIKYNRLLHRLNMLLKIYNAGRVADEGGLNVGVYPFDYRLGGTDKRFEGATSQAVTDNATRVVYIDSSNAIQIAASYPADVTTFFPLATVIASGGDITSINDDRGHALRAVPQTTTSSDSGTNNTSWTMDADNAGAGASQQLKFNRGTDGGGEDAQLEWDETNDRFNLESADTAETQAALNLLEIMIAGSTILDTNGVRKVASNAVDTTKGITQSSGVLELRTATTSGTGFNSGVLAVQTGDGVQLGANGVELDLKANDGLQITSNELAAKVDDSTVEIDSSNGIQAKDGGLTPAKTANYTAAAGAIPLIFSATLSGGSTVSIFSSNAPYKFRVIDAWSVATSADGGSWTVDDGTTAITDAVTVTGTDKTVNRAGTIDDAEHEIAASGSLRVVGDGANADCIVYVQCMRVS